jgi:4-hydroxy-4-methyl-2-oxoglutarate aldolase
VTVSAGDLIVGDADGVVAVATDATARVLSAARRRDVEEAAILTRIAAGERTLDIYGWRGPPS